MCRKSSRLTSEEIEYYAQMRVKGIIYFKKSNKLFRDYIQSNQTNGYTLKYLEFYEFSDRILSDLNSIDLYLPQLLEMCPEEIWKKKINDVREVDEITEDNQQFKEILNELKYECLLNIEHEREFDGFIKGLVALYKKEKKSLNLLIPKFKNIKKACKSLMKKL